MLPLLPWLPALWALLGCAGPELLTCEASLVPDLGAVATVTWSTDEPALGRVAYGTGGGLDLLTDEVQATEHAHTLLGLPPQTEVGWQATAIIDGEGRSCAGTLETPALPAWVAELSVTVDEAADEDPLAGAFLAAVYERGTYVSQVLAFDRQGVVRWYHQAEEARFIVDVQEARDGAGIVYDQFHNQFSDDVSAVRRLGWDGTLQVETALPMGHHMFAQLPDGGIGYQALDVRDWTDPETGEVRTLVGDAIAEVAPDGAVTTLFSAWDWLPVEDNAFSTLLSIYPQGEDWTHGNALKLDEDAGEYLLSLGNAGVVMTVDRATGEPTGSWGAHGVPVAEGSPPLEHQHDPTWLDADTLLVFDSHFDDLRSGAHQYELVDGQLEHAWSHESEDALFALILGQASRLDDGGTWVNFGSAGVMEEVDAQDTLRWRVELGEDLGFAQARWLPDFPTP